MTTLLEAETTMYWRCSSLIRLRKRVPVANYLIKDAAEELDDIADKSRSRRLRHSAGQAARKAHARCVLRVSIQG